MTETPANCPNCQHPQHLPGTECDARIDHGPSRFHACLCLARPGAANACPPQMTCQGGTLGYADIWYLQQGHSLSSADGVISPEVLNTGPVAVGFPSQAAVSSAGPAPATDQAADLAQHVARAIFALKTPSPDGSQHYQSGWDDGLDAAMDAARDAVLGLLSRAAEPATSVAASDASANGPGAGVAAPIDRAALVEEKLQIDAPRLHFTDRAAEEHRLALSEALGLGTGAPWDAIHDRATELGLPPLDQDPVARRLGLVAEHRAAVLREAADGFDAHAEKLLSGIGDKAVFVAKALQEQAAVWREAAET
ncbi:hypothetical protein, partial [Streptomyces sp. NPDC047868]|uniref:hypothetical protein n=1 Tax=Streptomyces sp. NPDC047868 TaxID=3155480 RepID=UPI0034518945